MLALHDNVGGPVVGWFHNCLDWRGLAWLTEVRRLPDRSEGLANRSEAWEAGLAGPLQSM